MDQTTSTWLRQPIFIVAKTAKYIIVLGAVLAVVGLAAGAIAARRFGSHAYAASAIAALINWGAGALALLTIAVGRNQSWRAYSVLLAMAVRMAPVLAAAMLFNRSAHSLAAAGVVGLIVVHYLVGLVAETLMSVRLIAGGGPRVPVTPSSGLIGANGLSDS
jgi:hypothetical protein